MGLLVRFAFPLIAYLCVASVVTVTAGYGYLRHTGRLDDETMFQIVALLHDVDLEEIVAAQQSAVVDVPPEEMSFDQRQEQLQIGTLRLQAKQDDLEKQLNQFESQFQLLNIENNRLKTFKEEVESYLRQREKEAREAGLLSVQNQLQNLDKKQSKALLVKMIKDGKAEQVILLLNGMSTKKRTDILKTFSTVEDIDMLYRIQERMLAGDPVKKFIDDKLQELNAAKDLEN